jgi:D-xylose reductase
MSESRSIPQVGFGVWKLATEQCAQMVYQAIKSGYRHLDCASDYGNEKEVGEGIRRAIDDGLCSREDLWITSKLWNTHHAKQHVRIAAEKSLDDLGLEYLDLYLIHFPIALEYVSIDTRYPGGWLFDPDAAEPKMHSAKVSLMETWLAMEQLVDAGLCKQIGVCNYNTGLMHDLLTYANIKPAMLQIESHPYLTQQALLRLCQQNDIAVTDFSPFGALSFVELGLAGKNDSVLDQAVVTAAAQRLAKTPAQIVLRWGIQRGCAIIPKTSRPERLSENLALFDFELSDHEMSQINALNANQRFNDPGVFCEKAFNTFHPIYD